MLVVPSERILTAIVRVVYPGFMWALSAGPDTHTHTYTHAARPDRSPATGTWLQHTHNPGTGRELSGLQGSFFPIGCDLPRCCSFSWGESQMLRGGRELVLTAAGCCKQHQWMVPEVKNGMIPKVTWVKEG